MFRNWAICAENIMRERMYDAYQEDVIYQSDEYHDAKSLAWQLMMLSLEAGDNAA